MSLPILTASEINLASLAPLAAVLVAVFFLLRTIYSVYLGPLSKFPGPKIHAFSIIPNLWIRAKGNNPEVLPALHARYGPLVRTGPNELSFVGDGQVWQDIHGHKKAGQPKPYKDPMFYVPEYNGVDSIISTNDANHPRHRKILAPAFSDRAIKEQDPLIRGWVDKLLLRLSKKAEEKESVDMVSWFNMTTFDIMGDLTFGENLEMLDNGELSAWITQIFAYTRTEARLSCFIEYFPFLRWFFANVLMKLEYFGEQARAHWDNSADRVNRRVEKGETEKPDFWSKIVSRAGTDGFTLSEYQANAASLMFAGTETTATALSGTLYYLLTNPEKMVRLRAELIEHGCSSLEDLTLERLAQLKYLTACLQEGMRLHPPVPIAIPRTVPAAGTRIGGAWVPGGTYVGIHQLSTYRDASNFERPLEYLPERWVDSESFSRDKRDSLEPFSFGPRNCIGKNLAWHEMRSVLASVVLTFDIKLAEESRSWNRQRVFAFWEKQPLMCSLTKIQ